MILACAGPESPSLPAQGHDVRKRAEVHHASGHGRRAVGRLAQVDAGQDLVPPSSWSLATTSTSPARTGEAPNPSSAT
ncbi:MAG TPA: hypothetical protein PLF81_30010 [Candidatus Anammoximicrobium sp.]|nr:hypothetical protein [Candidatus Anammoximicrobium sp.]